MNIEERLEKIEVEIKTLKERNVAVDTAKAWEKSISRRIFIIGITYLFAMLLLGIMGNPIPYIGALVPAIAYYISTQSLPLVKKKWIEYRIKRKQEKLDLRTEQE